jgi:molybdopterin synthase catalytic subunit
MFAGLRERAGQDSLAVELPDGAVLSFQGTPRDIAELRYEAYADMARVVMETIAAEVAAAHGLTAKWRSPEAPIWKVEVGEDGAAALVPGTTPTGPSA